MNTYNGFSPTQRIRALAWLKDQVEKGLRKPTNRHFCDACGQDEGQLCAHSEDYSEPFGDHIGQFTLCYVCHMMVHCRFRSPDAWRKYKGSIALGARFKNPPTWNWHWFRSTFLAGDLPKPACINNFPRENVLQKIEDRGYLRKHPATHGG